MVSKILCLQKYCQTFARNVSCFCSLPCIASTLVLSHAQRRRLPSSTLKLRPHFVVLEVTISISNEESWIGVGVFWDTSKNCAPKLEKSDWRKRKRRYFDWNNIVGFTNTTTVVGIFLNSLFTIAKKFSNKYLSKANFRRACW